MSYEEILKAVFPLLEGADLASCMAVCKQWRDMAQDDYFWKCVCAKRWPSVCKRRDPPTLTYYKLYQTFYKRQGRQILLPPRLSFDNLEFFIDIWTEDKLIFSEVVPGPALHTGIKSPPPGICDRLRFQLEGPDCKMTLPVEPGFKVPLSKTIGHPIGPWHLTILAYHQLTLFVPGIRAWISLLFMDDRNDSVIDVFGIEMDFCDAAKSRDEVLWLLDILDWK
ncbi:hypothetical protein OIU77_021396 [Salix suchowensis]|uniref:F-box domain-containing protein n=1 Tax=Salix suchowensis TaxID=1278906 RepID=A0ABQ9CD03_9ROSI|nr:hypothetical protein OIU77_021396 [Salix suchowensis]